MKRGLAAGIAIVIAAGGCTSGRNSSADRPSAQASSRAPSFSPGAPGAGDPYFPTYGNGGYDVGGYDLALRFDPGTGRLSGTATITATATQDLSRFNLDLAHLTASEVTVDGRGATSQAEGNELVVTPAVGLLKDRPFTVVVRYAGVPQPLANEALGEGGWFRTADGAFAVGQPESASTWFPVNDHPSDKATFKLAMTVPDGLEVLSNGVPGRRTNAAGWTTWTWSEGAPMASYLATVAIGQYRITTGTHDGKPMIVAVPASMPAGDPAAKSLARTGEVTDFLATQFGPYPFDANGGVVVADDRLDFALETQTRPVYGDTWFDDGENTSVVAHELGHQWYGNSLALERWQDIWLNEGFATYAEWLWREHEGQATVAESFDRTYTKFKDWSQPTGKPGPDGIFDAAVYERGAMTLYALRRAMGDTAFAGLLKTWAAQQRDGNVTTTEFIAAAQQAAGGTDLDPVFQAWLFGTTKPPRP
ncbi:peptidase M1-like protein [Krasilnikovia cinnamomea]|uniref:Aminopeptidase N n=1 Tax=Krasilnikovia cinnamomea TaxID=349313 RepID=A0A4Q7ZM18_9ACTN|nr:M1 family metallopeptidase [Krasilnikovia cinnamomea]RZU52028.1 peptidase M1-like protein [Krasilnikovia cinnamomea]